MHEEPELLYMAPKFVLDILHHRRNSLDALACVCSHVRIYENRSTELFALANRDVDENVSPCDGRLDETIDELMSVSEDLMQLAAALCDQLLMQTAIFISRPARHGKHTLVEDAISA